MSCAVFLDNNLSGACSNPAGPGEIGSACAIADECKTAFCKTTPTSVCGTCQPLPSIGDPCDEPFECGHALTCAFTAGTCHPRRDVPDWLRTVRRRADLHARRHRRSARRASTRPAA
jgi:hypothetical protein